MAYGIVRLDKVRAVRTGEIESVVYEAGDLQNGFVGVAGDLKAGERELRVLTQPTDRTAKIVLIANPEINYSEYLRTDYALENFFIKAGKAARAYRLARGDMFSITYDVVDLIGATPTKNNYLVTQAGSFKLKEVTTLDGTEGFVGKIADLEQWGTSTVIGSNGTIARINKFVVVDVIQN